MKQWAVRFVLAFQMLTRIPIRKQFDVSDEDFGKASVFFPFVGLVLGLASALCVFLALNIFYTDAIAAVLAAAIPTLLSGCLHLDGLGDTADGLLSGRDRAGMLEIMHDSRIGAGACTAIVLTLLIKTVLYCELIENAFNPPLAVLLIPLLGRFALVAAAAFSEYARKDGLGRHFIETISGGELAAASVLAAVLSFVADVGFVGIVLLIIAFLSAFLISKRFSKKFGGMTGDTLGATCELTELIVLAVFCLIV